MKLKSIRGTAERLGLDKIANSMDVGRFENSDISISILEEAFFEISELRNLSSTLDKDVELL